jgi:hypothetical protein
MENGCDLLDYRIEYGTIIDVTERVILEEVDTNASKGKKSVGIKGDEPPKFEDEKEPGMHSNWLLLATIIASIFHFFLGGGDKNNTMIIIKTIL